MKSRFLMGPCASEVNDSEQTSQLQNDSSEMAAKGMVEINQVPDHQNLVVVGKKSRLSQKDNLSIQNVDEPVQTG